MSAPESPVLTRAEAEAAINAAVRQRDAEWNRAVRVFTRALVAEIEGELLEATDLPRRIGA
jgi:hypothetical protein